MNKLRSNSTKSIVNNEENYITIRNQAGKEVILRSAEVTATELEKQFKVEYRTY